MKLKNENGVEDDIKRLKSTIQNQNVSLVQENGLSGDELWVHVDHGSLQNISWSGTVCTTTNVYYVNHKKKEGGNMNDKIQIFSEPLILVDAWHSEGDEESKIKFKFMLGDMPYSGTKKEVAEIIIESGLTGTDQRMIKLAVAACVQYYHDNGKVNVRESYEAMGVYERDGRFVLISDKDEITNDRGTEPWILSNSFKAYNGDLKRDIGVFSTVFNYFPKDKAAIVSGFAAVAPFFYVLKGDGNFFMPLILFHGPPATGKTTLGELFTTHLYGVRAGGPSDVTSDFRLLDFVQGTTFPRLVDETENAKFEGQKFSIKITATLKDASQKQFVGVRGNADKTKKLYAARTPMIMAGNKFNMEDSALRARSLFIPFDVTEITGREKRDSLQKEVLSVINDGFGIKLTEFILSKFPSTALLLEQIRNYKVNFHFSDPRRDDFYSAFLFGLNCWNEFYKSLDLDFPLKEYLEEDRYLKIVENYELTNIEETQDRQNITTFIDWVKTKMGLLEHYESERQSPPQYMELKQMFRKAERDGKTGILVTQTALGEFKKFSPSFPDTSLSEVADSLSKFYKVGKDLFYRRQTEFIRGRNARAVWVPIEDIPIDAFV